MSGLSGLVLKEKIRSGQPLYGGWVQITDPTCTRVLAQAGYDFLIIDTEHSAIDRETLQQLLLMFEGTTACPLVRVPENGLVWAKWALDCGAEGILVPNIINGDEAALAVASAKYPPEGRRGFAPRVASNFYLDLPQYLEHINQRTIVWVQVEHIDAVKNLTAILTVPGVDAIFIGPADLSASMGIMEQWRNPLLQQTIDEIIRCARAAGVPVGIAIQRSNEEIAEIIRRGVQIVTIGIDWVMMQQAAAAKLASVRKMCA